MPPASYLANLDALETTAKRTLKPETLGKALGSGDIQDPFHRLACCLTLDTAQLGTPSGWHIRLQSALPDVPVWGSSSAPCGDCRSFGKSQQSPRNTPEEEETTYMCMSRMASC
jgi:hypothetical protein